MSNDDWSALIPMLRKIVPAVVAQEIVSVQPMQINMSLDVYEKPIHGARYYCVEVKGWGLGWTDMENWAKATYGEPGEVWPQDNFLWPEAPRWVMNNRTFWFRKESDRTLFILKWSK